METNNNSFNVSVILPIKSAIVQGFDDYFKKCIDSIKNQKVGINELVIVHTDETQLIEFLDSYDFGEINVKKYSWGGEANYAMQINYGVSVAESEWVSLFEIDDEYSNIWFKNVKKYTESYPEVNGFLPLVIDVDEKGVFAGFTNEATFALNISAEMGYLMNETLHTYQNFQISGMVLKKDVFLEYGKIKPSFKLTFGYEFFLRLTYNSVKIMTIPKIGYKHTNMRTGSIFWNYKNGGDVLTENEVKFWIESAKKEYFFTGERGIKYEPQEV
jgi:glycosyltransferase involved in cell wall biosynthesis